MNTVFPNYYKNFKCIADKCNHNCCIGWEIDIDDETAEKYKNIEGILGERLKLSISFDGIPHFILKENDRCPFLNEHNLCDIITELSEDALCSICNDHPRFKNELPGRVEIGLGMACEEAARLILSEKEYAKLVGEDETDDEIILLRNRIISLLQNRDRSIDERIDEMLLECSATADEKTLCEWADILLSLERLDEKWTKLLEDLKAEYENIDFAAFDQYMTDRKTEYEQLIIYFIYRHFSNAPSVEEASARACFAALGYRIIHALGALIFQKEKEFTLEDQVELCRLFSSEIEYSDENVYILLDEFYKNQSDINHKTTP